MFRKLLSGLVGALLVVSLNGTARAASLDVGVWGGGGCCKELTRGYWFTAPMDFIIDSIFLLSGGSLGSTLEVVRLDSPPPTFSDVTNSFVSLGFWSDVSGVSTSIGVEEGDIIGILGYDGVLGLTPYRDAPGPYETVMGDDLAVTLYRLGFQDFGHAYDIWTEGVESIGSIGMTYHAGFIAPVPEPETYAMLLAGLGLLGFAARRRKLKLA